MVSILKRRQQGGVLGGLEPAATTYKSLYRPGSGVLATVTVTACNRNASTRTIRIAVAQSSSADPTPGDGTFKIYDRTLSAAGDSLGQDVLQITDIVLNGTNNDQVVVYTSGVDVDFTCDGITESV
jgi:hypothetical protein